MPETLLEVRDIKKYFPVRGGIFNRKSDESVKAVDGISFSINRGETLGLVGESGCGKSTLGRVILQLIPPTGGEILFHGKNVEHCAGEELRQLRRKMQIVFQDPYASLNPRMTIFESVKAPLDNYHLGTPEERKESVSDMLSRVGLASHQLHKYPNEFSGGQRQRVDIARALILNPEFVVCDEPVSALDVSVRAQVLNLMQELQKEMGLTCLFISHDLSVVKHVSDRVAVMYLGNIVEIAERSALYKHALHPYTRALLSAIPVPKVGSKRERNILAGDIPSPYRPPEGCKFHTRCPYASERCRREPPALVERETGHMVACYLCE